MSFDKAYGPFPCTCRLGLFRICAKYADPDFHKLNVQLSIASCVGVESRSDGAYPPRCRLIASDQPSPCGARFLRTRAYADNRAFGLAGYLVQLKSPWALCSGIGPGRSEIASRTVTSRRLRC